MFISVINYRFRQIASNIKRGGYTFSLFLPANIFLKFKYRRFNVDFFFIFIGGGGHIANCREMNKSNVKV